MQTYAYFQKRLGETNASVRSFWIYFKARELWAIKVGGQMAGRRRLAALIRIGISRRGECSDLRRADYAHFPM